MNAKSALVETKVSQMCQISAEPVIEPGNFWLEGKDLKNCASNTAIKLVSKEVKLTTFLKPTVILFNKPAKPRQLS